MHYVDPARMHCEKCSCTWLDDGLNPTECPYCLLQAAEARVAELERIINISRRGVTPMSNPNPNPCPFCGCNLIKLYGNSYSLQCFCMACKAAGPKIAPPERKSLFPTAADEEAFHKAAIHAWNRAMQLSKKDAKLGDWVTSEELAKLIEKPHE